MKVDGGGERKNEGKLRWDLVPFSATELLFRDLETTKDVKNVHLKLLFSFATWWNQQCSLKDVLLNVDGLIGIPTGDYKMISYLREVTKVLQHGAEKYDDRNWERGMLWSQCYNSGMRHLVALMSGKEIDAESGLPHLSHFLCNVMFLVEYTKTCPQFDNRPGGDNAKV